MSYFTPSDKFLEKLENSLNEIVDSFKAFDQYKSYIKEYPEEIDNIISVIQSFKEEISKLFDTVNDYSREILINNIIPSMISRFYVL